MTGPEPPDHLAEPPDDPHSDRDPDEPRGTLRPLGPAPLVSIGLVGLVAGWLVRPLSIRAGRPSPDVPPLSVGLICFAAAILAAAAYFTWRTLHRERRLMPPHHAVNRFVLARACAFVASALTGGYVGNAIAHLGVGEEHARTQVWWSLGAAAAAAALLTAALLLERACRVPRPPEDPDRP